MEMLIPILAAAVRSGTPILYATLGEIITEKAGILNLGLEGIMLVGAYTGFAATYKTGNPWIGVIAAFLIGGLMAAIHAFITIKRQPGGKRSRPNNVRDRGQFPPGAVLYWLYH